MFKTLGNLDDEEKELESYPTVSILWFTKGQTALVEPGREIKFHLANLK